ncbi:MAG: hypothetical protein P4L49_12395 [Desulfosporosinus sp.]|nr:hypothetical protein [Desulfosporosinus sp.]
MSRLKSVIQPINQAGLLFKRRIEIKDRRVRKTEQAIQAAFTKLLSEKSMENITVNFFLGIAPKEQPVSSV